MTENAGNELVKYEAAKHALSIAKSVDEVKNIHDVSAAMKAYAVQAQDRQLEIDASEIRIRAERRLGEMIKAQKDAGGLAKPGTKPSSVEHHDRTPTLSDVGISKDLSSRAQKIASIPEPEFEEAIADHRHERVPISAAALKGAVKGRINDMAKQAKAEMKEAAKDWTPEMRASVAPEMLRQRGEIRRLVECICALPNPIKYGETHWREMAGPFEEKVDQAICWLDEFRNTKKDKQ
tara:strand:+ start:166 stop:873 length:708 start_codon:yes stop_codon:yes gene_type:complete